MDPAGEGLSLPPSTSETDETNDSDVEQEEEYDKSKTYRRWVMTIFDEDGSRRKKLETIPGFVRYMAYGDETTKRGRKHYQCFVYTDKPIRWTQFESWIGKSYRAPMRGTFTQNEAYCSKQGKLKEFGDPPEQGQRKDLLQTKRKLEESPGQNIYDVAEDEDYFGCIAKHSRFMAAYHSNYHGKRAPNYAPVEVIYCHGPPGSGKTRWVRQQDPNVYVVPVSDAYKWKDGYNLHAGVLFDNIAPQNFSPTNMLIEIDCYKVPVPYKGGFVPWKPKTVYLTSIFPATEIAQSFGDAREFLRRITVYKEFPLTE